MRWGRQEHSDVLVVCTGNVCRSPYIAARLSAALPELVVSSAGTGALVGEPPTPEVIALLSVLDTGRETQAARARDLRRAMVRQARLVITAQRTHRVATERLGAVGRSFTLLELERLIRAAGSPSDLGVEGVINLAQSSVRLHDDNRDHDDDLADPYGKAEHAYAAMAERVEGALGVLVPALRESGA